MKIGKYTKLPVEIEAMQLKEDNIAKVLEWINTSCRYAEYDTKRGAILIYTLEGVMHANVGDWIIKGIAGEFYPCKDDIFRATYKESEESKT